jgi:hypothetical protein
MRHGVAVFGAHRPLSACALVEALGGVSRGNLPLETR